MMTNLQKGKKMDCLEKRRDTIGLGLNNRAGSRFIRPCFSPRVTIIHHAGGGVQVEMERGWPFSSLHAQLIVAET